jgi:MFS family permease
VKRPRGGGPARHGRHAALFALVAGLLLARAPGWAASVLALGCAALALAAGRRSRRRGTVLGGGALPGAGVALACALAVLGGSAAGRERLKVVDSGRLAAVAGSPISGAVVLLEPMRRRGGGPVVARVRLAPGRWRGRAPCCGCAERP